MKSKLVVPVIKGQVHLGCTAAERAKLQKIEASIVIVFSKLPDACKSDRLPKTPCYAEMSELLTRTFAKREFHTIENLCLVGLKELKLYLKKFRDLKGSTLRFKIDKLKPPIEIITAGCQFSISTQI